MTQRTACLVVVLAIGGSRVHADAPTVSYIFPAGGQRGTTVSVRVGGHYLHGDCRWQMTGDGVEASELLQRAATMTWFDGPVIPLPDSQRKEDYPWEHLGGVKIDSATPCGVRRWRVWTSQGVTPSRKFIVGDLPEVIEEEIDGVPVPTHVDVPVTINGRIFPREDVDVWAFDAKAGTSYVCQVVAERIGSPLDSRLEIHDPHGRPVAENVDRHGRDSYLRFQAAETGRYEVHIHDVNFDGLQHFVYRLTITDRPRIEHIFPLGGQRGTSLSLSPIGQSLPRAPLTLTIPPDAPRRWRPRFDVGPFRTNRVPLEVSEVVEQLEVEPNGKNEDARPFQLPTVLNGRIMEPGDVDVWRFDAAQGDQVDFEVRAARLGSPLDAEIAVYEASGGEVGSNDDLGKGVADSRLRVTLPSTGVYYLVVRDRFRQRGGPAYAYRIEARAAVDEPPGFAVDLPTDGLTLTRGGETKQKFTVARQGGFAGPIELRFEGLPTGVKVSGNIIGAKKNDAQVVFAVDPQTAVAVHAVQVVAVATIDEQEVVRPVVQAADSPDDLAMESLLVAIAMPTPFKVVGTFETRYADRGSTFTRRYRLERGGYSGPLQVRLAERQVRHLQGVTGETVEVPAGVDEFDYRIKLPSWMEIGRTSRTCVMAVAEVEDESGQPHTVSYTSHAQNDQIIILVDPGQLDLRVARPSLVARPGHRVDLQVDIARGKDLGGDVRLELVVPGHMRGMTAQPVLVPADQQRGTLTIEFAADEVGPLNQPLVIRATAQRGGQPYTACRTVKIVPQRKTASGAE